MQSRKIPEKSRLKREPKYVLLFHNAVVIYNTNKKSGHISLTVLYSWSKLSAKVLLESTFRQADL